MLLDDARRNNLEIGPVTVIRHPAEVVREQTDS